MNNHDPKKSEDTRNKAKEKLLELLQSNIENEYGTGAGFIVSSTVEEALEYARKRKEEKAKQLKEAKDRLRKLRAMEQQALDGEDDENEVSEDQDRNQ